MKNTIHRLICGDARNITYIPNESVHLVVTSPPYWNLKRYNENPNQMGHIDDYELFLRELEKVLKQAQVIVVLTGHHRYQKINFGRYPQIKIVYDTRNLLTPRNFRNSSSHFYRLGVKEN